MKPYFKRLVSVLLCVSMVFSLCAVGASASNDAEIVTVSCEEKLANLNADVPVIFVSGVGGEYYKGLSTETEEDDVQIWGPQSDVILEIVKENIFEVLKCLIFGDYDELIALLGEIAVPLFGDFSCDENGVPDPDTGRKDTSDYELKSGYGYENSYTFVYDWRLNMSTVAAQLDEYVDYVMEITGSDKVAFAAMSMGNSVMTTYLYEYYYTAENYAERNHIDSVIFIAGAMNGVGVCEDPFSGNITVDSTSLMRFLAEIMLEDDSTKTIYYVLEVLYSLGALEPIVNYVNNLTQELIEHGLHEAVADTIGTIPGFYALMGAERYEETRDYIFSTPEKQAKYAKIIEAGDYYHECVQANNTKVIQSLLDDGINTAIIAEYGYSFIPITSDNNRMTDGTIATDRESFGATCAELDGTLGEGYIQAKECECGKNHVSPDNQIDASTCAFPDITWFGKYLRHTASDKYIAELANLVIYSDEQITVWHFAEYPQYLINLDDECLVPLTAENAGEIMPYEETTFLGKIFA